MIAHIAPTLGVLVGLSAQRVFYPYYLTVPRLWGLSALDDQALGWGLMAVLNGLVYAITFLLLVAGLAESRIAAGDHASRSAGRERSQAEIRAYHLATDVDAVES